MSVELKNGSSREKKIERVEARREVYERAQDLYEGVFLLDKFSSEEELVDQQDKLKRASEELLRQFLEKLQGGRVKTKEVQGLYEAMFEEPRRLIIRGKGRYTKEKLLGTVEEWFTNQYPEAQSNPELSERVNEIILMYFLRLYNEIVISTTDNKRLKQRIVQGESSNAENTFSGEALLGIKEFPVQIAMRFPGAGEEVSAEDVLDQGIPEAQVPLVQELYKTYRKAQSVAESGELENPEERNDYIDQQLGNFIDSVYPVESDEGMSKEEAESQSTQLKASLVRLGLLLPRVRELVPSPESIGVPKEMVDEKRLSVTRKNVMQHWVKRDSEFVRTNETTAREVDALRTFWVKRLGSVTDLREDSPEDFDTLFDAQEQYFGDDHEVKLESAKKMSGVLMDHYLLFFDSAFLNKHRGLNDMADVEADELIKEAQRISEQMVEFFTQLDVASAGFIYTEPLSDADVKELERYFYNYAFARITEDQLIVKSDRLEDEIQHLEKQASEIRNKVRDMRRAGIAESLRIGGKETLYERNEREKNEILEQIKEKKEEHDKIEEEYRAQVRARMRNVT